MAVFDHAFDDVVTKICAAKGMERPVHFAGPGGIWETVLVPHGKRPLRSKQGAKAKFKKFTHDLGDLVAERRDLFTCNTDGPDLPGSALTSISFDLPLSKVLSEEGRPELIRPVVKLGGLEGAKLFLRLFYGLRNILSHGEPAETFAGALKIFVDGTGFSMELFETRIIDPDVRTEMVKKATSLLTNTGCEVIGAASVDDVADWMVKKIWEFGKHRRSVRISTVLLETMHSFLSQTARAYCEGLVGNCASFSQPWDAAMLLDALDLRMQ